ncbi:MAG: NusG domain II-containing protein [Spirochaetales bacterium]|nr:NusG domain II-containing protein [Spirochaetales bacterium]
MDKADRGTNRRTRLLRDIILIAVLLAAGIVLLVFSRSRGQTGSYVCVMVQNQEIARYSLAVDGVNDINGGTNTIEIKDGRVRMIEAICPNHLCIRQGWIRFGGQSIVCLPNKLSVIVLGTDDSYDFVL